MSTERIYRAVLQLVDESSASRAIKQHLDVGAGTGRLIELIQQRNAVHSRALDYTKDLMKRPGIEVDVANLNNESLPYPDGHFDLLTATEVIEHLEHYRETVREFYRVLRPGGLCILTTPNILNLNSRLRYLWFGFPNLFGPLPVRNSALYSTGGHINPVSWFYVAHALLDAGFEDLKTLPDKFQRSSVFKAAVWAIPIRIFGALAMRKEARRFKTLDSENEPIVRKMNSWPMLFSRTLIVAATKPA